MTKTTISTAILHTICPHCGAQSDRQTGERNTTPAAGAILLCYECAEPSIYLAGGVLRRPSESERAALLADPTVQRLRDGVHARLGPRAAARKAFGS